MASSIYLVVLVSQSLYGIVFGRQETRCGSYLCSYGCYEAIARLGDGLDDVRRACVISEDISDL
jgi:hypothetical protein